MSRIQKVIALVLAVVFLGALLYFFVLTTDDERNNVSNTINDQTSQNENEEEMTAQSQKQFTPLATTSESFVVELEATDSENDVSYNGTVSYDGEGNYLLEGVFKNDRLRFYEINDEYISCQNDTCFSLPTGENGVDTSTYAFTEESLEEYRNSAEYVGESDCPAGTCETWNVSRGDGTNITFYIANDGKISKAEGTVNESSFSAVFTYQPVSISRPENVTASPL